MKTDGSAKYLYCFMETRGDKSFPGCGVENGCPVYTIRFKDVAVVVTDINKEIIKATTEDCLSHEKVIEQVMKEATVLPFEFGTVSPDKQAVINLIKDNYTAVKKTVRRLYHKAEVNVRAVWPEMDRIFKEISAENRDIVLYKKEIAKQPVNATYNDRIRIGQMVSQALYVKKEKELDRIVSVLRRLALGYVPERIAGDNMIFNAAFLIRDTQLKRFEAALYQLDKKLNGRVNFRYLGPLPPYNFTDLKLKLRG